MKTRRSGVRRGGETRAWAALLLCAVACGDDDGTIEPDAGNDAGTDVGMDDTGTDARVECTWEGEDGAPIADPPRFTPRWAFEPWISKDISDRDDTEQFVDGFLSRNIPVGALVLDSPWETQYNTLIPNPDRYGDFQSLVDDLHAQDIKIVLWTTQMINTFSFDLEDGGDTYMGPSPNYGEGDACGFFVNDGQTYTWWKGRGAAIDFFHPGALGWWREQMDIVLDAGIDGWKLDFGESYIRDMPDSYKDVMAFDGMHTHQEYSEEYYAEFLRYGVQQRGEEFVTMVRGFDVSYDHPPRFYARPEHAPVVWMGDNERDFPGMEDALDHAFRSANVGYVVVGWDIGGYLDVREDMVLEPVPFDQEVFARWTGVSAFMPFFQLHGRANLEPWNIEPTDETTDLYRYWATLHSDMVPFWFSLAQEAYAGGDNIIRPIGDEDSWAGDWRFQVGDAFLIAPPLEAGGIRDVDLPEGTWFDWWDPSAAELVGPATLNAHSSAAEPNKIPVFVRAGAIVPMEIDNDVTGFGSANTADHLVVLVWQSSTDVTTFTLHDRDDATTTIRSEDDELELSRTTQPTIVRMRNTKLDVGVEVDGVGATERSSRAEFETSADGYFVDGSFVWVKVPASEDSTLILLRELAG